MGRAVPVIAVARPLHPLGTGVARKAIINYVPPINSLINQMPVFMRRLFQTKNLESLKEKMKFSELDQLKKKTFPLEDFFSKINIDIYNVSQLLWFIFECQDYF